MVLDGFSSKIPMFPFLCMRNDKSPTPPKTASSPLSLSLRRAHRAPRTARMFPWSKKEEVAQRTDDDIDDEPAGIARKAYAKASEEARQREAAEQDARNAVMRGKIKNVEQRTDDDIMDEAAGRARLELAAASKARKASEAKELARRNAEMKQRLEKVAVATDDDIMDEEAGRMRLELAAASKARREEEAKQMRQHEEEYRKRGRRPRLSAAAAAAAFARHTAPARAAHRNTRATMRRLARPDDLTTQRAPLRPTRACRIHCHAQATRPPGSGPMTTSWTRRRGRRGWRWRRHRGHGRRRRRRSWRGGMLRCASGSPTRAAAPPRRRAGWELWSQSRATRLSPPPPPSPRPGWRWHARARRRREG